MSEARDAADRLGPATSATGVELTIAQWHAPVSGWSGRLGPVRALVSHSVRLPPDGVGPATVAVEVAEPAPVQALVAAALAALEPARLLPAGLTAEVAIDGDPPPWLGAVTRASTGEAPTPPPDVRLAPRMPAGGDPAHSPEQPAPAAVTSRYGLLVDDAPRVLLDISRDNPIGRASMGHDLPAGTLRLASPPGGEVIWRVTAARDEARVLVEGRAGDPLTEAQRAALARLGMLHHVPDGCEALPHAAVLAQLCTTGVVVRAPDLPPQTAALLSPELAGIITSPAPDAATDPVQWEISSIAQRRAAMRGHDAALVRTPATLATGLPTVTAVVVSRRPHYVPRVLEYLAAQTYPRLEVVLAMHGVDLDAPAQAAVDSLTLPVQTLALPADLNLGQALAEATLLARGSLLTKVDDDDRYGPEHVWDLVLARRYSGATLVGKIAEFVHLATHEVTVRRRMTSEIYTTTVAGGTILISRGDLEDLGGWRPVPRSVDRALLDRVRRANGLIYQTHGFGYIYTRHGEGHTWDPGVAYFLTDPVGKWPGLPPYAEFEARTDGVSARA
ncbi:MAG TPA: glycosyltransferase [Micromonosporaceae bacterium]